MKICVNCKTGFNPRRSDMIYCSRSCGDEGYRRRKGHRPREEVYENIVGKRFGKLLVICATDERKATFIVYKCLCDCGREVNIPRGNLTSGNTKSCGCLHTDNARNKQVKHRKHGKWDSAEYKAWIGMKSRCNNPKDTSYKYYGGRGITVCEEWLNSFENFYDNMGDRPEGTSLDRIDPEKGYHKENCKWSTYKEQANNRRNNVKAIVGGEEMTAAQYSDKFDVSHSTALKRIRETQLKEEDL